MTERPTDEQLRVWIDNLPDMEATDLFAIAYVALPELLALRVRVADAEGDSLRLHREKMVLHDTNIALRAERAKVTQSDDDTWGSGQTYDAAREICDRHRIETGTTDGSSLVRSIVAFAASIRAEGSAERAKLEAAAKLVIYDIHEYEHANNLYPNPGRTECWDSVADLISLLAQPAENGAMEREAAPSSRASWPVGCHDTASCVDHADCMYVNCPHDRSSVRAALVALAGAKP